MKKVVKKQKNMTIDDLAIMVAKGFESVDKGFENTVTKDDLNGVNERLDNIEFRLSKIESNHDRRIDKLEDKMSIIYTAFEKQLKIKLSK